MVVAHFVRRRCLYIQLCRRRERGPLPWKAVTGQIVIARLDGQVRELLVTAWHRYSGAVKVAWPPQNPAVVSRHPFSSNVGKTEIAEAGYEPLDPESFRLATKG